MQQCAELTAWLVKSGDRETTVAGTDRGEQMLFKALIHILFKLLLIVLLIYVQ